MTNTPTRRAVLAGTAAMPALALPAVAAETPTRRLLPSGRWVTARKAETAYNALAAGCDCWDDDPQAVSISDECERCYQAMVSAVPTTAEGAALMFVAHLFDRDGTARNCRFENPETWGVTEDCTQLRDAIWNSRIGAELLRSVMVGIEHLAGRAPA